MVDSVSLFCLIYGNPVASPFKVEIGRGAFVSDLRKAILNDQPNEFKNIDSIHLLLWKANITIEQVNNLDLNDANILDPMETVGEVFENDPPKRKCIHIIVKVTGPTKREGSPLNVDLASRIKRIKVVHDAPSELAKPSTYETIQRDSKERILDDRPQEDDIPPVSLLFDGFGQFLDIFAGHTNVEGFNNLELQLAVDEFAQSMCGFFADENTRRDRGLNLLNKIFAVRKDGPYPTLVASYMGSVITDGHYTGPHGVATLITKFKNWSTGNSAIPEVEVVAYFARSLSQGAASHPGRLDGRRVPGLGITVVGPDVRFYAILNLDVQFRLVSLTPALSCIRSASEGDDRDALYRAFIAASMLQVRILEEIPRNQLSMGEFNDIHLPDVSKLRRWQKMDPESDNLLQFQIKGPFAHTQRNRHIYTASRIHDGQTILVKFVRRYCPELHDICATSGYAPALLAYERLPGGWYGVAMEYVADAVPISLHGCILKHFEHWKTGLQGLVAKFHDQGYVHGDLRDANIISGLDGHVKLIDFDWGGRDGAVSYPTPKLNPELVEGRSSEGLRITKVNDLRILAATFAKTLAQIPHL